MRTESHPRGQQRSRGESSRFKVSALIAQHSVLVFTLGAMLLALSFSAQAQQPVKMHRVGLLALATFDQYAPLREVLEGGLRELGYVEGQNIVFERRFANGRTEGLSDLATELVRLKLDVIVTGTN